MKKDKLINDNEELVINPFLKPSLSIPAKKLVRKASYEKLPSGERVQVTYLIDSSPYYRGFISADNTALLSKLSGSATKVYLWAQNHSSVENDYLFIKPDVYMKANEVKSIKTFRTAISELIRFNILQRYEGRKYRYWYNPELFNRGNRLTKYRPFVKID